MSPVLWTDPDGVPYPLRRDEPPDALFHATRASAVAAILRDGVRPMRKPNWTGGFGQDLRRPGHVYAFRDFRDAAAWAFKIDFELRVPAAIVCLRDGGLPWTPDRATEAAFGRGEWIALRGSVPPGLVHEALPFGPLKRALHPLAVTLPDATYPAAKRALLPLLLGPPNSLHAGGETC